MDALEQKQEEVNAAGAQVRALKAQNADADAIAAAIAELKRLKVDLEKDLNALKAVSYTHLTLPTNREV